MRHAWIVWVLALIAACATPSAPPESGLEPTVADALATLEATPPPSLMPDAEVWHRRPPSGFVPASPDTRSQADIDAAACWGFEDGRKTWRCRGTPPTTFMAGASSPIIPSSWTVPNWFVNKSTGSDSNTCTSSGSPCATKQEIWVHRLGAGVDGPCPRFQQTTTLEQDASDTDNTDPIYSCGANEKGGSLVIKGGTPTVITSGVVLAGVTAKNRTLGANSPLIATLGATAAVGQMVINTTAGKSSRAWVVRSLGANSFELSQPLAPASLATPSAAPAEVDTWANTDTVNLVAPIQVKDRKSVV